MKENTFLATLYCLKVLGDKGTIKASADINAAGKTQPVYAQGKWLEAITGPLPVGPSRDEQWGRLRFRLKHLEREGMVNFFPSSRYAESVNITKKGLRFLEDNKAIIPDKLPAKVPYKARKKRTPAPKSPKAQASGDPRAIAISLLDEVIKRATAPVKLKVEVQEDNKRLQSYAEENQKLLNQVKDRELALARAEKNTAQLLKQLAKVEQELAMVKANLSGNASFLELMSDESRAKLEQMMKEVPRS